MFSAECPNCGRVLLTTRAIRGLIQSPLGLEIHFRCDCGHEGAHLSGRRSLRAGTAVPVDSEAVHG